MTIALGKILDSESHVLYHARIYDESDCEHPPSREQFSFGTFVRIQAPKLASHRPDERSSVSEAWIGLITNSRLLNPERGHYGPQLTIPHSQNEVFAPDYLSELGVLVSILLVGGLRAGVGIQGIPPLVIPVGSEVFACTEEECVQFHHDVQGRFQMRYYPLLSESGPSFAAALLQQTCERLWPLSPPEEQRILTMIRKNMAWQSTLGTQRYT